MNKIAVLFFTLWSMSTSSTLLANSDALYTAAREGDSQAIKSYARNAGDLNITNAKSHTAFILAACYPRIIS